MKAGNTIWRPMPYIAQSFTGISYGALLFLLAMLRLLGPKGLAGVVANVPQLLHSAQMPRVAGTGPLRKSDRPVDRQPALGHEDADQREGVTVQRPAVS